MQRLQPVFGRPLVLTLFGFLMTRSSAGSSCVNSLDLLIVSSKAVRVDFPISKNDLLETDRMIKVLHRDVNSEKRTSSDSTASLERFRTELNAEVIMTELI